MLDIGVTRFELVTSCSQGRRANQAALHPEGNSPNPGHPKHGLRARSREAEW